MTPLYRQIASVLCLLSAGFATAGTAAAAVPADTLPLLWAGRPAAGWHWAVAGFEAQAPLKGRSVQVPKAANSRVPKSRVTLERSAGPGRWDALTLHWDEAWYAALRMEGGKPLDLRPYLEAGTLEFELKVDEMTKGGLHVAIGCGKDCHRKVNYVLPSRALAGQGWQHLAFSLRCFHRQGDDFSAVPQPFILDGSGRGTASVAQVRFVRRGQPNAECPDYRSQPVTASPLNQVWALEWWMGRHEQKVKDIQARRAAGVNTELIFIGDSITHGWEDAGRKVWDEFFSAHHALGLGFGGDHTENVLWRLQHGEVDGIRPKLAVMMIGTNNTGDRQDPARYTAAGIQRLLDELRQRLPGTRVLLLAIFPRDEQPDSPLRQLNDQINGLISAFADGDRVSYLNINPRLMNADGSLSREILPDLLHLSEAGYRRWAEAIDPTVQRLLNAPPLKP